MLLLRVLTWMEHDTILTEIQNLSKKEIKVCSLQNASESFAFQIRQSIDYMAHTTVNSRLLAF